MSFTADRCREWLRWCDRASDLAARARELDDNCKRWKIVEGQECPGHVVGQLYDLPDGWKPDDGYPTAAATHEIYTEAEDYWTVREAFRGQLLGFDQVGHEMYAFCPRLYEANETVLSRLATLIHVASEHDDIGKLPHRKHFRKCLEDLQKALNEAVSVSCKRDEPNRAKTSGLDPQEAREWLWRLDRVKENLAALSPNTPVKVTYLLGAPSANQTQTQRAEAADLCETLLPHSVVFLRSSMPVWGGSAVPIEDESGQVKELPGLWFTLGDAGKVKPTVFVLSSVSDCVGYTDAPADPDGACEFEFTTLFGLGEYGGPTREELRREMLQGGIISRYHELTDIIEELLDKAPSVITHEFGEIAGWDWDAILLCLAARRVHPMLRVKARTILEARPAPLWQERQIKCRIDLTPDLRTATMYALEAFRHAVEAASPAARAERSEGSATRGANPAPVRAEAPAARGRTEDMSPKDTRDVVRMKKAGPPSEEEEEAFGWRDLIEKLDTDPDYFYDSVGAPGSVLREADGRELASLFDAIVLQVRSLRKSYRKVIACQGRYGDPESAWVDYLKTMEGMLAVQGLNDAWSRAFTGTREAEEWLYRVVGPPRDQELLDGIADSLNTIHLAVEDATQSCWWLKPVDEDEEEAFQELEQSLAHLHRTARHVETLPGTTESGAVGEENARRHGDEHGGDAAKVKQQDRVKYWVALEWYRKWTKRSPKFRKRFCELTGLPYYKKSGVFSIDTLERWADTPRGKESISRYTSTPEVRAYLEKFKGRVTTSEASDTAASE